MLCRDRLGNLDWVEALLLDPPVCSDDHRRDGLRFSTSAGECALALVITVSILCCFVSSLLFLVVREYFWSLGELEDVSGCSRMQELRRGLKYSN